MNMLKKSLAIISFATIAAIVIAAPIFASIKDCIPTEEYPNLSTESSDDFPIKCVRVKEGEDYITIYAKTSADCAQASSIVSNPDICENTEETTRPTTPSAPSTTKETTEESKTNNDNNNSGAVLGFTVVGIFCGIILIITIIVGVKWFRNLKKDIPEMVRTLQEPNQNDSASGQDFHMVEQPQNPQNQQNPQDWQNPQNPPVPQQ